VKYLAFGLTILSEIDLPELFSVDKPRHSADIEIKIGNLIGIFPELNGKSNHIVINKSLVVFQIPKVALFSIQDGKYITISPFDNADNDVIRLYILGTCMGILLMQRKILPLHGSVFEANGKAYAIVGDSGAGKSTLASVFLKEGFKLLSDDVIAIAFLDNKTPYVIPSYPQQKLWENSLNKIGMPSLDYKPLFERETKYAIPIHTQFRETPLPLSGIFELEMIDRGSVHIEQVKGVEGVKTLYTHTYRNFIIPQLGLQEWHFDISTKIINNIDMYKLQRSKTSFTAFLLADMILDTIEGGIKDANKHAFVK
jgi:hypothetical protein